MKAQLQVWLDVMISGSKRTPRRLPRLPQTVAIKIASLAPIMRRWSEDGITSLAEITASAVRDSLPPSGPQRVLAEQALRSVFTVLMGRKLIFTNPTRGMQLTAAKKNIPLPMDTDLIRGALDSANPAIALAVALVAFHGLASNEVRNLQLTDIVDGRLTLGNRMIPLAEPVRVRLSAWLDHRARTWPRTIYPHLLVTRKSAPRLSPPGRYFPWTDSGISPRALRDDRILNEILASGGDVRRICDLFGLGVDSALRYAATVDRLDTAQDT
jgi:integrase